MDSNPRNKYFIESVHVPKGFKSFVTNDIALVKLKTLIDLSICIPMRLGSPPSTPSETATVAGYGIKHRDGTSPETVHRPTFCMIRPALLRMPSFALCQFLVEDPVLEILEDL